ncbi:GyrI-like domain-containing protein [Glutamicibacter mishrai]|uniref:GyrI-like small molecule binding domain-containing protein n=1 Tax=Glutamicibacter mishrai TaxID=1775880 RepID=A0A6H0SQH1_9MICC|nr:GyrI-like domain-containing protein [Glutamicibacter mishrai]QIV88595.1 hypothetical protein D3791_00445 [Glutamicibacter mishrai]
MAEKIDFKKVLDGYRARPSEFRLLRMPATRYLMIDGHGDPNLAPSYTQALETIYPVAYKLKFSSKQNGRDYVVPPLEGLWWADNMESFTTQRDKSQWYWTLMLMVPDWITAEEVQAAVLAAVSKRRLPSIDKMRLEELDEGECVQTLHLGAYDDEGPVLEQMHKDFILGQGLRLSGKHHEIYLGDPRKVAPERLRTILRQPVASL